MDFRYDLGAEVHIKSKAANGRIVGRIEYKSLSAETASEMYLVRHVEPHAAFAEPIINVDDLEEVDEDDLTDDEDGEED